MQIHFLNLENSERDFFTASLKDHSISLSKCPCHVPRDAEILSVEIEDKIDAEFLDSHPALRLIATRSSTIDHIDVESCAKRGIMVSRVPDYSSHAVAEHTFALILALARRLREAMETNRPSGFSYESLRALELHGKTLGVIGVGQIGSRVLQLARCFGMRRLAYDVRCDADLARRCGFRYVSLTELLARSDIISLHATATPSSYHLLNRQTLSQCRRGVMIINTARGALIDTEALIEAIDEGIVGCAGLDVLEDERVMRKQSSCIIRDQIVEHLQQPNAPRNYRALLSGRAEEMRILLRNEDLLSRSNVIFTPHIAFNTSEAVTRINWATAENIHAFLDGCPINIVGDRHSNVVKKSTIAS